MKIEDRELLHQAAIAGGVLFDPTVKSKQGLLIADNPKDQGGTRYWNPLANDGDAFRLMVSLQLDLEHVCGVWAHRKYPTEAKGYAINDDDNCEAARRAIVLAAANLVQKV